MRILSPVLYTFLVALLLCSHMAYAEQLVPEDKNAAVILAYHRVGEDAYPETNIRVEQFRSHITELTEGAYNILPLPRILAAQKNDEPLPHHSIAITFDGGHKSVIENAVPLLLEAGIPFTIFVAADQISSETNRHIDWSSLRKLAKNDLVTIGLHPAGYTRLYNEPDEEIRRQINNALVISRKELGQAPKLFAYPFGETSAAYINIVKELGFNAAFGQHSGVSAGTTNPYNIPRFSMTESFGDMERFRMIVNALPIHATDIEPADPLLSGPRPDIGFTMSESLQDYADRLSCFISDSDKPTIEKIGTRRVELRLQEKMQAERIRVNCTMSVPKEEKYEETRWRWLGMLLVHPKIGQQVTNINYVDTGAE